MVSAARRSRMRRVLGRDRRVWRVNSQERFRGFAIRTTAGERGVLCADYGIRAAKPVPRGLLRVASLGAFNKCLICWTRTSRTFACPRTYMYREYARALQFPRVAQERPRRRAARATLGGLSPENADSDGDSGLNTCGVPIAYRLRHALLPEKGKK